MSGRPPVVVVIPVYNGAYSLGRAIESVIAQTMPEWTLIVADNASDDGTAALAHAYAGRDSRIVVREADEFVSMMANWNRALSHVPPEAVYVKQLGADEVLLPTCLAEMVALAERHPSVSVVGAFRREALVVHRAGLPFGREVMQGRELVRQALLGGPDLIGAPGSVLMRATPEMRSGAFYDPRYWPPGSTMGFCRWSVDKEPIYGLLQTGDFGFVHQLLTDSPADPQGNTPFVWRLRAQSPGDLQLLVSLGPRFLTPRELRRAARRSVAGYAWLLAKQGVKLRPWRDGPFRVYHRAAAATLAISLRRAGMRGAARALETMARLYDLGDAPEEARFVEPRATTQL